jgi:hypothetical protein
MQSDAKRTHSNSYFRNFSDSGTVHLLKRPFKGCTASRVLSVVYATEKGKNNNRSHAYQPVARLGAVHGVPGAEIDRVFEVDWTAASLRQPDRQKEASC